MNYYKLTDKNGQTRGETQWGENVTHRAVGWGSNLCTYDVIHVYDHPVKAVIFNLIHADFQPPRLWECRVRKVVANDQLKVGVKQCTTVKEIPLPYITLEQKVKFAVLYALEVYHEPPFVTWAKSWLSGKDRTARAAIHAADVAYAAGEGLHRAAADVASGAAYAATCDGDDVANVVINVIARVVLYGGILEKKVNFNKLIKQAMR